MNFLELAATTSVLKGRDVLRVFGSMGWWLRGKAAAISSGLKKVK